jgi:hypothetical protein
MLIGGPVADVVDVVFDQSAFTGAFKNTGLKVRGENFGKDREYIEAHRFILALRRWLRKVDKPWLILLSALFCLAIHHYL